MKASRSYVRDNVPLSRFGVLVAQLESIVASASQQLPDPLLCFDLLSDLIYSIDEEPKESILLWQRKCEDAVYSLLVLGARRPVRHLASVAMAKIISKGDGISIYSRASALQGFLSDGKKSEPHKLAGASQCLGELYHHFGRRITSGLQETTIIAVKLLKFQEVFVRQEALLMLQKALEGSGGAAASSAYSEAFRLITRSAVGDKSYVVRIAAARCLKAFSSIGGPGLGVAELDSSAYLCVKALEDPVSSVRDAFAEALGLLLALGMNPEAQVQPRGKGPYPPAKKLDGGLQRHLCLPFIKASGIRLKDIRIGVTLSWVFFLQAIHIKYLLPDNELQNYALQVMDMLCADNALDAQALACILYILRVGITDQMTEPTQRGFLVFLGKQLESVDVSASMKIAALRTISYTLKTLGEVPLEFKEVCDNTVVAAVSHSSQIVRVEAALTLQVMAEVDPTCVGGLISYGMTTLSALRENISFEKGSNLKFGLDSFHGQATVLAALVHISPKLPLGYPARLPKSILEISKRMLEESSRNPVAATIEKEAGWLLLSSLLSSMPHQELESQVFDILSLWANLFSGNPKQEINNTVDLTSTIRVCSAAMEALTAFVRCFVSPKEDVGILLQPVMVYLSSALEFIMLLQGKELPNVKPAIDILIIRTLMAYKSLPDRMAYKSDHPKIIQLCTVPYRDASRWEESSCLRLLLDKRDAWLGPWTPGRDWLEDELRTFQGGKDGIMPCVWESDISSFPQPETINKMLVNEMLLCFGIMFASQDAGGMLFLLGTIEQCLKAGKKQSWHAVSITNICVGLLAGLKALIASRPQPLGPDVLNSAMAIFQSILAEGDICASHRRASSEGLGLLARLGNDIFTARMTRLLLGDLSATTDSNYASSIAFALGCIHRSAGGMALSTLVPATVSALSLLAKSAATSLQIWSLHGLLLTVEAAGFSYVSHVQATLGLSTEILLSEENGLIELQQGVGRLINAIVAVLGPELSPGSIFFSRCKSVIAEISSQQETATLLESVRFTQQLVLFAPHAVSVHFHVQTLLSTLSSRQPTLRHLAISTLRHLIEKDPGCIIDEQIEDNLFHMLDEETDPEIGNLVRAAIMRLLLASCPSRPSHWIIICRSMILSTAVRRGAETNANSEKDSSYGLENDPGLNVGEDDENMVASSSGTNMRGYALEASGVNATGDKHLRYRTRVFAAECLSHLPSAVGDHAAHFDLSLARRRRNNGKNSGDWLVLYIEELISLAYQISTIQFENMRPIGVDLLNMIVDKFEAATDPELSGHLLLEQYQAQLVSAVRTALDVSSGPILLETGLQLATKIMTSGILGGDQSAVKRIFALLSRPLNEFKDIYYPSFAEWVSSKIKIRLLAAHASLKCYTYAFLRRHHTDIPDEYLALLPLFAKSSGVLGKYWMQVLKDYTYTCLSLNLQRNWTPFLDGIESPLVVMKLQSTFEEAWPVILQALALDAVPITLDGGSKTNIKHIPGNCLISGHSMVELEQEEYQFLWGFALLVLFQQHQLDSGRQIVSLRMNKARCGEVSAVGETNPTALRLYEIVLPVFQFLSSERFFKADFLTMDVCQELLQVFSRIIYVDNSWNSLALSVITQIVQSCPEHILESEKFSCLALELLFAYIFHSCPRADASLSGQGNIEILIFPLLNVAKTLVGRFQSTVWKQSESMVLALLLLGYNCMREASTELWYSTVIDFLKGVNDLLRNLVNGFSKNSKDSFHGWKVMLGTCLNVIADLTKDCIRGIHLLEHKRSDTRKVLQLKLSFYLEESISLAKLAYEIECPGDTEGSIYYTFLKKSSDNVRSALKDGNLQVQAIGLQVLKTNVRRSTSLGDCTFLVLFCAELVIEILAIAQTMLKKPLSKESVAIVGECLRYLMLLQTLARSSECQRAFLNLLLQAVILVFSAVEDDLSQEAADVKAVAVRLVSHLAQIPTSAIHIKDVLLSMPTRHRQQLQDLIRASVDHDQNATQTNSATALEIKLPVPKDSQPSAVVPPSGNGVDSNFATSSAANSIEKDEEDDDWEAFQSFPASTHTVDNELEEENAAEEPEFGEKSFGENRISASVDPENSPPLQHVKTAERIDDEEHQSDHEEEDSGSKVNIDKTGPLASQSENNVLEPYTDHLLIREEENVLTRDGKEETIDQAQGYTEANVEEDHKQCVLTRDREVKTTEQTRVYAVENVKEDHEQYVPTREREEEATGQAQGYTQENVGEDQEQHVLTREREEEATEQAQGLAEENVGENHEQCLLTRDREKDATEQACAEENVGEDHEQRKETPKHEGDLSLLPASSSVIDHAGETNIIHEHGEGAKEAEESTGKTRNGST